jgi:hypothetical protein
MPTDDDDDEIIIIRRSTAVEIVRRIYREHMTKVIGYATVAAGAIAVMDPALVADTLGPNAVRWALVVTGVLTALRGHTNKTQPAPK